MRHVTEFPRKIVEHADMGITMPDGTRLSARVWMPEDAAKYPVPAILEHLPYRKRDGTIVRDEYTHPWMAGHGYCCIRVDMRGNGESEGLMEDEYTEQELQDACDVIAWAASQPWCNGNVGMMGISWGGFNGLQVAALQPPALKAVVTLCSTTDRYADDIHYKGGCLLVENMGWTTNMLAYSSRPPDPALVGDKWMDMWLERLEAQPFLISTWLRHQHRDEYWKHGSVCEDYSKIKAAVLSIGGWHDGYRNTISHLVENLEAPVKGIVGPWIHKYPHYAGPKPAIGFLQEAKRWWDKWLKDEETGVENDPAYRAYLMDSIAPKRWFEERPGRWIAEENWPSSNIKFEVWHFNKNNELGNSAQTINEVCASPLNCGSEVPEYFPFAFSDEFPGDQSCDDALSLCFDSDILEEARDIVGAPIIKLRLSSDKPTGQIGVRLNDLRPDGTSAPITYGVLNLTHRNSHATPKSMTPDLVFDTSFALDQIAYRLPAGHRLRVSVSTSWFPYIWPSLEPTKLTLSGGSISVPLRPLATEDEWEFEEPEGATPWQAEELRPAFYKRTCNEDESTGETITLIHCDFGKNRDLHHGLISGGWFKERWSIHPKDPNSAKSILEWQHTGGRKGQMWRTHVTSEFTSDRDYFYPRATVKCWLEDQLFFEKTYEDKIKRDLV